MPIIDQYGKSIDDRHLLIPSDCWKKRYSNGMVEYYLEKYNGQLPLLTVEDSKDMGNFKNGVAVWRYYDEKTNNTYATLMDEKGNKKFNPVKCGVGGIWNDGQNILQYICYPKGKNGTTHIFTCWDGSGKKTGTINIVDSQDLIEWDYSNGIQAVRVTKKLYLKTAKLKILNRIIYTTFCLNGCSDDKGMR